MKHVSPLYSKKPSANNRVIIVVTVRTKCQRDTCFMFYFVAKSNTQNSSRLSPIYKSNFSLTSLLVNFFARVDDQQVFLYNFHIFLVVRLHEQISDLTIFPCQGKASMPDFL